MAEMKHRRRKEHPKQETAYYTSSGKDKPGLDVKYINSDKGRGVFSSVPFDEGEFLLEYRGQLISKPECDLREKFRFNGGLLCVDATIEDGSLGRTLTLYIDGKPHLCLFATRNIYPVEEITYNYGDCDWPWRSKVAAEKHKLPPPEMSTTALFEALSEADLFNLATADTPAIIEHSKQNVAENIKEVTAVDELEAADPRE